jgi:hypothetical protein
VIDFDQDMLYPKEIDQKFYNSIFGITLFLGDGTMKGKFMSESDKRELNEEKLMPFRMEISNHTTR